jgi:hypothetical protein
MSAQMSSSEAAREFEEEARALWEQMDRWMDEHPDATLKEMEQHLRPLRRELGAKLFALQLLKRGAGVQDKPVLCSKCDRPMEYKGILEKPVVGIELEGELPRAYYHCPRCGEGLFPPRHPFAAEKEEPVD